MTYAERQAAVKAAIAEFPAEFGLRAFPDKRFRIFEGDCYWSELDNGPMLYTSVLRDGKWLAFAKGTPAELRRELVKLPEAPREHTRAL